MSEKIKIGIVGSGPSGALIAKNLASFANFEVHVFEKGSEYSQDEIEPYSVDEIDKKYERGGGTFLYGSNPVNYGAGQCLGGGSEINAGLYYRVPKDILHHWRYSQNLGAFCDEFTTERFAKIESLLGLSTRIDGPPLSSIRFLEGAKRRGFQAIEVPRWVKYSYFNGQLIEVRQSMTEVIWKHIASKVFIHSETRVFKIVENANNVELLSSRNGKNQREVFDYVFLCAGAINTPTLLLNSNIPVENVGAKLAYHPTIKVVARFDESLKDNYFKVPSHQIKSADNKFGLGVSIHKEALLKVNMLSAGFDFHDIDNDLEKFGLFYCMTKSDSASLKRVPVFGNLIPLCFEEQQTAKNLLDGLTALIGVLEAGGANNVRVVGFPFDLSTQMSSVQLKDAVRNAERMTIHLMSTCPIGVKGTGSIDQYGKVFGSERCFVADASSVPSVLGVNPQGTIMCIADIVSTNFIENHAA